MSFPCLWRPVCAVSFMTGTGDRSRDDGEAGISRLAPDIEEVAGSIVPWPNDAASALRH